MQHYEGERVTLTSTKRLLLKQLRENPKFIPVLNTTSNFQFFSSTLLSQLAHMRHRAKRKLGASSILLRFFEEEGMGD